MLRYRSIRSVGITRKPVRLIEALAQRRLVHVHAAQHEFQAGIARAVIPLSIRPWQRHQMPA